MKLLQELHNIIETNDPSYEEFRKMFTSDNELINGLVKGIVLKAFRDGPLEDIHSKWIPDECMKILIKNSVNEMYPIVESLLNKESKNLASLVATGYLFASKWDDADLTFPRYDIEGAINRSIERKE